MIGGGQLNTRIHVYDGRLWVDRGGGGQTEGESDATSSSSSSDVVLEDEERRTRTSSQQESSQQSLSSSGTLTTATMSQLLVDKAQMFHSGRYVCSALGASGTWTLVHILAGKKPSLFLVFFYLLSMLNFYHPPMHYYG